MCLYRSTGILEYSESKNKLILRIDRGIYLYYRSFIPNLHTVNGQRHPPHISVVRNQIPPNLQFWGKYEGEEVEFYYENIVRQDDLYLWLDCYSARLEDIRIELGLPLYNMTREPRQGFLQRWHTTIGNIKL